MSGGGDIAPARVASIRELVCSGEQDVAISPRELVASMASVRSRVQARLHRIEAMVQEDRHNAARREQRQFLSWLDARILALYETRPSPVGSNDDQTTALVRGLLDQLPKLGRDDRPSTAYVRWEDKPSGGRRPISRFAWIDKAEQRLIDWALTPFAGFHPAQAMLRVPRGTGGRTAACRDFQAALASAPADHVLMHLDVVNFHGSIDHKWLEDNLALPRRQRLFMVHTGRMRFRPEGSCRARPTDGELQELTRRGIPHGSAAASRIAEYVMAEVLRSFADRLTCTLIVVYSDNIAVLAPRREAHATAELFREAFRTHGAGPFDLRVSMTPLDREIRFLGYSWRVQAGAATPYVPAPKALAWMYTVEQSIYRARPPDLDGIEQYVRGWCGSRNMWEGVPRLERHLLALIEKMKPAAAALANDPKAHACAEVAMGWPGFATPGPQTERAWIPAPAVPAWRKWRPFDWA